MVTGRLSVTGADGPMMADLVADRLRAPRGRRADVQNPNAFEFVFVEIRSRARLSGRPTPRRARARPAPTLAAVFAWTGLRAWVMSLRLFLRCPRGPTTVAPERGVPLALADLCGSARCRARDAAFGGGPIPLGGYRATVPRRVRALQLHAGADHARLVFLAYGAHGVIGGLVALLAMLLHVGPRALIARHWAALRHRAWAVASNASSSCP